VAFEAIRTTGAGEGEAFPAGGGEAFPATTGAGEGEAFPATTGPGEGEAFGGVFAFLAFFAFLAAFPVGAGISSPFPLPLVTSE